MLLSQVRGTGAPPLHHRRGRPRLYACTLADSSSPTLQRGLDVISEWCKEFFMEVSVPKTEYADFKARNPDSLTLYLNGVKLNVCVCVHAPPNSPG